MKHNKCSLLRFIFRRTEGVFLSFFFGVCMCAYALSLSLFYTIQNTKQHCISHLMCSIKFVCICLCTILKFKNQRVYIHIHTHNPASPKTVHMRLCNIRCLAGGKCCAFFSSKWKRNLLLRKLWRSLKAYSSFRFSVSSAY